MIKYKKISLFIYFLVLLWPDAGLSLGPKMVAA